MKNATIEQYQKSKEKLATVGMSIFRNLEWGTFQVYLKGTQRGGKSMNQGD